MAPPTASVVVIGSEVLSAKIEDENGPWLARRLRELGVRLLSITVVPDRLDAVVEAVDRERRRATWLFTTGGVGPTHDDLTLPAVAAALGRRRVRSEAFALAIREGHRLLYGDAPLPEAALRMADVPEGTRLAGDGYPVAIVENVVLLPGVPRFLRWQFDRLAPTFAAAPAALASVYVRAGEGELAPTLDAVALAHPDVELGSYPRFDDADHAVRITLEAEGEGLVRAALAELLARLPASCVVRVEGP